VSPRATRARSAETEDLWGSSLGFFRVWVAHLGRQFGLLQELAGRDVGLTPSALAARCACHAPTVTAWCEAAHALGLLERTGGRYGLQTMCEGGGQANVTILERL